MTGIAVEIIMKETVGIITENIMNIMTIMVIMVIMVIITDRDVASRDRQPCG
jgi:hypothetical protein